MKKFVGKLIALLLAAMLVFALVGCKDETPKGSEDILVTKDGTTYLPKSGTGLRFYSSDKGFASFLNDFYSRHVRDNSDRAIGGVQLGQGWTYQKQWEALYLSWFDSTARGIDGYDALYNLSSTLDSTYVSDYGCVSVKPEMPYQTGNQAQPNAAHGWPFTYGSQTGNYYADFLEDSEGWKINGEQNAGTFHTSMSDNFYGFWEYAFKGDKDENLTYERTGLGESVEYAPMVEVAFYLEDLTAKGGRLANIEDIVLSFKMEGDSEWNSVSYYDAAIHNIAIPSNGMVRAWFPVYLHPAWTGRLDGLKVELLPREGEKLEVRSLLNYVHLETDTRFTNTNAWYITAMEEYLSFTGDKELLARNLEDLRKAMMFQLYALSGENGLLKTDYIRGKTTTIVGEKKFGMESNGWYDALLTGTVNLQANIGFYQSLLAMANIEEYAAAMGIEGEAFVNDPYPFSADAEDVAWTQTADGLRALAATVKTNVQKDVADGGLWNPETGRFAWAIYDEDSFGEEGTALDYGYTEFNLMAVMCDIASPAQKESIMSWIDGTRAVSGDQSQGDDMYFYEFAPRTSTKKNTDDCNSTNTVRKFGTDIQNGGASMHVSFYDLLARHSYYGADNSFGRFKEIQAWYDKVRAAEGAGESFYRQYYGDLRADFGDVYKMQGGGTAGPIGLDAEFYESALLYAAVPYTYFGLDAALGALTVSPSLPSGMDYMAMENLMFRGIRYDLYISADRVVVSGVRGQTNGEKIRLNLALQEGKKVYVDGRETAGRAENGRIAVEVPFGNFVLEIK